MLRIAVCLCLLSWPMTGHCDQPRRLTEGNSDVRNSNARYERHSRSRHHVRQRTHDRRDESRRSRSLFDPDRSHVPAVEAEEFSRRRPAIEYPYTTGTSILDQYKSQSLVFGVRPAIGANSCDSPVRDLQYLMVLDAMARY